MKARDMALSSLVALGRHTVTGMIAASGGQFKDWSSTYRLFERERIDKDALFAPAIEEMLKRTGEDAPLFCMMDDTLVRKRGKKVYGTQWRRDPLGPPFHTNFVWGQRFLQLSCALPDTDNSGRARAIPIDFIHAPSPIKPKRTALTHEWEAYHQDLKASKVSVLGRRRIEALHEQLPKKKLVIALDGAFTNSTVMRGIPENTVLIGRVRKDARPYAPPDEEGPRRGRKRFYGTPLLTPEELRQDESFPWQEVEAYGAGKRHVFNVKVMNSVRWKGTGDKDVSVIAIRPLSYRKSTASRLLYRQPAYLICTNPDLPLAELLQAYLWRWEIELNFRDEKCVLGVGEAQVRDVRAVKSVPALIVASYSYLLLASSSLSTDKVGLPRPKWRRERPADRLSTQQMIALLRSDLWRLGMDSIKTHFVPSTSSTRSAFYSSDTPDAAARSLKSAVCYAFK
jgi:hypothetical protein